MELEIILNKIRYIREQKVMLDFDLAEMYEVETRVLKQAVRRNIDRFPPDFMFELTKQEFENLRSQNVTSKHGGTRYMPLAFTEHGVAMLSSVLRNQKAIQINIAIIRAFIELKKFALTYNDVSNRLEQIEIKYDKQFSDIHQALNFLLNKEEQSTKQEKRKQIGYKK